MKFTKKAELGLDFFQTQAVFDLNRLADFMKFARQYETKIIVGVRLLSWEEIMHYRDGSLPGVTVPLSLIEELRQAGEAEGSKKALDRIANQIREIKSGNLGDGIHIMAMGQENLIPEILAKAGLVIRSSAFEFKYSEVFYVVELITPSNGGILDSTKKKHWYSPEKFWSSAAALPGCPVPTISVNWASLR